MSPVDKPVPSGSVPGVNRRPSTKSKSKKAPDRCLIALGEIWPAILRAYHDFKHLEPIVEYRVQEKIVLAWPAQPYIDALPARTRERTWQHYADVIATSRFLVFVCDHRKRILRSHQFPVEGPMSETP